MHDKFFTAAGADSKLRKLRDDEKKAQNRQFIFMMAVVLVLLALIVANSIAI